MVQSFTLQDWSAFAEIYGIPLRVGKYGPQATDADKRTLLYALRSISSDGAAAIPASMQLEFMAASGQHGEAVFGKLIEYMDKNVSKLVLGQTMTSDDGSSLGQAKIHNEVRLDILRADGRQTATTIHHDLVRWFVALNFGPQDAYPRIEFPVAEPEDIKALSEAVDIMVPLGLRVSQREMGSRLGLSEPEETDELLKAPTPTPIAPPVDEPGPKPPALPRPPRPDPATIAAATGGSCRCPACSGKPPATLGAQDPTLPGDEDVIDELLRAELSDWQEITDPLLERIFALAAEETTYEGVLRRLDSLRLDSRPLTGRLARASAIARGIGDLQT
jgi:phage gp29-like protein